MTQADNILNHLKSAPITPLDALMKYNCFRLAARIADLREKGHGIVTETVNENGKSYARYRLVS